jgi:hypothetical protein
MGLNPYNIWFPLIALMGVVVIAPATFNWLLPLFYDDANVVQFLATMVLPLLVLFIGAGWLEPG